ncbi:hypothetical protein GWE18_14415 [Bradyrhizobium sp. CSA112]|uniref:hypothetical protein n=1 Tax=Bradyrhizobium sp. CSA112 TaxID=2699170 RepID=UPI0023B06093|nr:hypothetical protein [Bradyrhizobium sp. CSA112]MDE5454040.1 hypothetical protein [Bradyrhizobium sp. CSA112]
MRTWVAWFLAIAPFFIVEFVASLIGGALGVPTSLDVAPYTVHYGRGAEAESSSITTAYGWGIHVLALLAATGVWHLVMGKELSASARAQFKGVLLGAVITTAGGIPLDAPLHNCRFPSPHRGDEAGQP